MGETLSADSLEFIEQISLAYSKKRDEIDILKAQLSTMENEKREMEHKLITALEANSKERWDIAGIGTLSTVHKWNFTQPKSPEAKNHFFNYLKTAGIFEELVSVNYQTLNAFCKREMEVAKERGQSDFQIPGIDEPQLYKTISLRKGA